MATIEETFRDAPYVVDPKRLAANSIGELRAKTGVLVRAKHLEHFGNYDVAELTGESLLRWLQSRGQINAWAENFVFLMLGHR